MSVDEWDLGIAALIASPEVPLYDRVAAMHAVALVSETEAFLAGADL